MKAHSLKEFISFLCWRSRRICVNIHQVLYSLVEDDSKCQLGKNSEKNMPSYSSMCCQYIWLDELRRTSNRTAEIWDFTSQLCSFIIWIEWKKRKFYGQPLQITVNWRLSKKTHSRQIPSPTNSM